MSAKYISASAIIGTNIKAPNPPKEITSPSGEKYTRTYMSYDFGQPGRPCQSEALFELKICNAKLKINSKNKPKLNLNLKDESDLNGLGQLSYGFALVVDQYKNKFGLRNFNPSNPGDLRGAFFFPSTQEGELIEGADAICSLKLDEKKSKFTVLKPKVDADGQPIMEEYEAPDETGQLVKYSVQAYSEEKVDYKVLIDKQFDCSVIICARDLYRSTGMPLPQLFVRSCMILSNPTASGEVEHTKSDMVRKYLQQNPDSAAAMNNLADQLASLKNESSIFDRSTTPSVTTGPINVSNSTSNMSQPINNLPQTVPNMPQTAPNMSQPVNNMPQTAPNMSQPINNYANSPAPTMMPMNQFQGIPMNQTGGLDLSSYLGQQQNSALNFALGK